MNFVNKLADAGAACVGTKMRGDIFLLFEPRELQFATSQSGNSHSFSDGGLVGLFSPRSRLGQDPHFVPSWVKPRVGEEEKVLAHPSQELCPGLGTPPDYN